jgi:SAM-dependent methyltransferase
MLAVANSRLGLYAGRVSLVEGDMREFDLKQEFDLVVVGLNTFMHMLTVNDQLAVLESAHRHLRAAGLLLLDLASPHAVVRDTPLGVLQHRLTRQLPVVPPMVLTLWSVTEFSLATQLTHTTLFFDEAPSDGGPLHRSIADVSLRLIYRYELEHLLHRAGFSVKSLYGDYESGPYEDDSERLICIASALA